MDAFIATIIIFAGNFAPRGWAFCDGSLLQINQYQAVFSLLGTTYGGNGSTTFALPDLRGRVPVGAGNGPNLSPYTPGEQVGTESVTLLSPQMPMHTHTFGVPCSTGGPEVGSPANAVSANYDPTPTYASTPTPGVNMFGGTSSPAGGSTPHENRQPSLGINYIICLEGIFPTRP